MNKGLAVLGGAGIGAALTYLLDPESGNRRRKLIVDKIVRSKNVTEEGADTIWRDLRNRSQGILASVRSSLTSQAPSDRVLIERVRSKLGTVVKHPRSIDLCAEGGRIIVAGPILAHEVEGLLQSIRNVPGVTAIDNRLEVHEQPGNVPGLQGDPPRPRRGEQYELLQVNWSPAVRAAVGAVGMTTVVYGATRRDAPGAMLALGGAALVARGLTNLEFKRLLGVSSGHRAVDIQKTMTFAAPIDQVFEFWKNYQALPRYTSHVKEVIDKGAGRSQWTVEFPGGMQGSWHSVITKMIPNQELAWKTEPDSVVQHAGILRFTENQDGTTTVQFRITYNPPAGAIGHGTAVLLGTDAKTLLEEDLIRIKTFLDTGKVSRDVQEAMPNMEPAGR
jgi:uncharacterized membrane protein